MIERNPDYPCLAGNDPIEEAQEYKMRKGNKTASGACAPQNCMKCGFRPEVNAYRNQLIEKNGLTEGRRTWYLSLPTIGATEAN